MDILKSTCLQLTPPFLEIPTSPSSPSSSWEKLDTWTAYALVFPLLWEWLWTAGAISCLWILPVLLLAHLLLGQLFSHPSSARLYAVKQAKREHV